MRHFQLGTTGMMVSEIGFGGIPIIRLDTDAAVRVLRRAYDRGVTLYDTANAYRDSEDKIGRAFQGMRDKVVIATKTIRRDGAAATEQLENSLRMLRTDYIDLYQLHQIAHEEEWQAVTAPGGALEAVVKAKLAGKVRHIGVTSHSLEMAIKLVRTEHFSTIQFPFNFIESDASGELFPLARELGVGILVMKPFAGGVIDNAEIVFKFLRQHPYAIPIPGFDSEQSVDDVVARYSMPNIVNDLDTALMNEYRSRLGKAFCRRCEYCQPCPKGVKITMAMGYPIFVSRMGPKVAMEFARVPMESVPHCDDCGKCIQLCPYDLPIPEVLKRNYAAYVKDREENPD
jgi:aryl-alcohol dehydrogenase-like predicted oxidoreductase